MAGGAAGKLRGHVTYTTTPRPEVSQTAPSDVNLRAVSLLRGLVLLLFGLTLCLFFMPLVWFGEPQRGAAFCTGSGS
jgi:hypothetical protein